MTTDYAIVKTVPLKVKETDATTPEEQDAKDTDEMTLKNRRHRKPQTKYPTINISVTVVSRSAAGFDGFCFALRFDFFRVLLSERVTPESRIMFRRKIGTRINKRVVSDRVSYIAPFLNYDPDPYIVINAGKLYWIIDFYVTSRYYPNAQMYDDDTAQDHE